MKGKILHYYSIVQYVVYSYWNEVCCKMQLEKMSLVLVTTCRFTKISRNVSHTAVQYRDHSCVIYEVITPF